MKVRKGFTLVELLIVIVIIGILAAAMLLSSGSATASAEASNIVSDLRSMKAAALMFFADSMDSLPPVLELSYIQPYMDNPSKFTSTNGYLFSTSGANWYVGFNLAAAHKTPEVGTKLAARAKGVGIYGNMHASIGNEFAGGTGNAWMIAR